MTNNILIQGVLLWLVLVALLVISQIIKNWLWARIWGLRKGDRIKISGTSNFDGDYKITKTRGKEFEIESEAKKDGR